MHVADLLKARNGERETIWKTSVRNSTGRFVESIRILLLLLLLLEVEEVEEEESIGRGCPRLYPSKSGPTARNGICAEAFSLSNVPTGGGRETVKELDRMESDSDFDLVRIRVFVSDEVGNVSVRLNPP